MSNVNTKPNGQSANVPKPAASATPQAPSVPISIYREVASELQTTRTNMQSLKTQNQELTQKNQQLRLEIERVVQSALHLRQLSDPTWGRVELEEVDSAPNLTMSDRPETTFTPSAENLLAEQPALPVQPTPAEPTAEINTWWLIVIICSIVITAFGTGFLIVRPLLPSR